MAINVNECRMSKSGYVITAKGRLEYAQFINEIQKDKNDKDKKGRYNGALLVPGTSNLTLLKNKMGEVGLPRFDGDVNRVKSLIKKRLIDPNNKPNGGKPAGPEFEGWTLIRASSHHKPKVFYPNGNEVPGDQIYKEMYSGRWAAFLLNPYAPKKMGENPGIFLGLQGVQLLDHDENNGANIPDADGEFDAIEVDGVANTSTAAPSGETSDSDVDSMFG